MFNLFAYCDKLVSFIVSSFDISRVELLRGIFYFSDQIKYLDLINFKVFSNANDTHYINYMFGYCKLLIYLNLYN